MEGGAEIQKVVPRIQGEAGRQDRFYVGDPWIAAQNVLGKVENLIAVRVGIRSADGRIGELRWGEKAGAPVIEGIARSAGRIVNRETSVVRTVFVFMRVIRFAARRRKIRCRLGEEVRQGWSCGRSDKGGVFWSETIRGHFQVKWCGEIK